MPTQLLALTETQEINEESNVLTAMKMASVEEVLLLTSLL